MSKKRISKQQAMRIHKLQQSYHQDTSTIATTQQDGLVIQRMGKEVLIEIADGSTITCSARSNLDTIVAGDNVVWLPSTEGHGVIVSIYPRKSVLAKPTYQGVVKPVAANITQLVIVIAKEPEINFPLLDSYLIMAELLKLHPVILLNKTDLPCETLKVCLTQNYSSLNYSVVMVSQSSKDLVTQLLNVLNKHISVFVGQSGVGKSSLIKAILPNDVPIQTNQLSDSSRLGRHTTSNSCYYHLSNGAAVIDSPGVREFRLWELSNNEILHGYREFLPYISQCKYRNCPHIQSPSCALIHAVETGIVSKLRYDNFVKLILSKRV